MAVSNGPNLKTMINALTGDSFDGAFRQFLREMDALVMPLVIDHTLTTPPASPNNGDRYVVAASPTGAWAGQGANIAVWTTDNPAAPSGEWEFYTPEIGWIVFTRNGDFIFWWNGTAWGSLTLDKVADGLTFVRYKPMFNAAGTLQNNPHVVEDTVTLSGGTATVTLSGGAAFSSATSYTCVAVDQTGANPVKVAQTSGTSITFTGTGTDVIRFICIGS